MKYTNQQADALGNILFEALGNDGVHSVWESGYIGIDMAVSVTNLKKILETIEQFDKDNRVGY
jgi:hypothetical protein